MKINMLQIGRLASLTDRALELLKQLKSEHLDVNTATGTYCSTCITERDGAFHRQPWPCESAKVVHEIEATVATLMKQPFSA